MLNDASESWKSFAKGIEFAFHSGSVTIPSMLLVHYRQLELSHVELILLIQLMTYRQVEGIEFPTPDQLSARLGISSKEVQQFISKLMRDGLLSIDELYDNNSDIRSERYNLQGLIVKLAQIMADQQRNSLNSKPVPVQSESSGDNIFVIFEKEFGRPLSPMEYETISGWLDYDRYREELILLALKESVFAGKLSFRYIDRILIDWSRNRVTNAEEARAHSQRFRSSR